MDIVALRRPAQESRRHTDMMGWQFNCHPIIRCLRVALPRTRSVRSTVSIRCYSFPLGRPNVAPANMPHAAAMSAPPL